MDTQTTFQETLARKAWINKLIGEDKFKREEIATATIALESTNAFGGTSSQIVTKEEARKLYRELFAVIGQTASAYAQEE